MAKLSSRRRYAAARGGVLLAAVAVLAATALAGCTDGNDALGEVPGQGTGTAGAGPSGSIAASGVAPDLTIEVIADGLENPWDIGVLPDGSALVTQRPGRITLLSNLGPGARRTPVSAELSDVYAKGEGGLLGMVIHPDFATSREFTTCLDHAENGEPVDIRLVTWRLSTDGASAQRVRTLLTGLPVAVGGRHSGCRPSIGPDGALLVGTGDTAVGSIPQDLTSLGGKVLRLDLHTGEPLLDNPYADAADRNQRYVHSFGHRNVQGVAVRPGTGQVFTAEHGPSVNDEVNLERAGGNYGWDPSVGGSTAAYDESVSMTDLDRFPEAVPALWQSGPTTQAICGLTFVTGPAWGKNDGALVVTALKGAKLLVLRMDAAGALTSVSIPEATNGTYGRLRAARTAPDGALLVTTSNGDNDKVLRITPVQD
ncbi:MAG: PQQ-dependent sugar dehydrogenase [Nostocoides sp.]